MSAKQPKEVRVESIIHAALEEFLEKGYDGASMEAVAKRAGVSKGGLYHHFANKDALLLEANKILSEPVVELAVNALANSDKVKGIKNYVRAYLKYWAARPNELRFFFLSMSRIVASSELIVYYQAYVEQNRQFYTQLFTEAKASGKLNISDPQAYGVALMGALDGILGYVLMNPGEDIEVIVKQFEAVWLKGM